MMSFGRLLLFTIAACCVLGCSGSEDTVEIPENPATSFDVQPVDPPPKPARKP